MIEQTCQFAVLEEFLSGQLCEQAESDLIGHLDQCAACQRQLEQRAGDREQWEEAGQLLSGWRLHQTIRWENRPDPRQGTTDVSDGGENTNPRETEVDLESVLAALGPTDDPSMLGRLGPYQVSGIVGSGAMGVVLKAQDPSLDRIVAIKVMAPHLASSGSAKKRFARESKAAAAVLHPNVIAIHSVSNDVPLPYLVMPYMRGESLQKRLDREGPMPVGEVLRIAAQIAAGLAAAHAQGLVHRDIKPANILLEQGVERVAITDFGLARAVDDATMTRSGVIAGTPQYMSPEQSRGESIDARSDLFSLGSVMYALCTGHPPFRAETTFGVLQRINQESPRSIKSQNEETPLWLSGVIDKLMSKQPEDRFESAEQVAGLLERCLAHVQQPSLVALPASAEKLADCKGPSKENAPSQSASGGVRIPKIITSVGAGLLGLLATVLWTADPQDISGDWVDDNWGAITLTQSESGVYEGAFDGGNLRANPDDSQSSELAQQVPAPESSGSRGFVKVQWSRLERRFNGSWGRDATRWGDISIHRVGDELRGALTLADTVAATGQTPRLSEFCWSRKGGSPAGTSPSGSGASLLAQLQGRWELSRQDQPEGDRDKPIPAGTLIDISGDQFSVGGVAAMSLRIDESHAPPYIDLIDPKGIALGRCQLVGNIWKVSLCETRSVTDTGPRKDVRYQRPKTVDPDSRYMYLEFKRIEVNEQFTARLPGGISVELVGITHNTRPTSEGWRPDGREAISGEPDWPRGLTLHDETTTSRRDPAKFPPDARARDLLFRFRGLKSQPSLSFELPSDGVSFSQDPVNEPYLIRVSTRIRNEIAYPGASLDPPPGVVRVALTDQPWGKWVQVTPDANVLNPVVHTDHHVKTYMRIRVKPFEASGEDSEDARPTIILNQPARRQRNYTFQMRGIDSEGEECWVTRFSNQFDEQRNQEVEEWALAEELAEGRRFRRFEYRVRPYHHSVTFQGVELDWLEGGEATK